jgi:hypothetical protein
MKINAKGTPLSFERSVGKISKDKETYLHIGKKIKWSTY